MAEFRYEECQRSFGSEDSLRQHNMSKHGTGETHSKHEPRRMKKLEREKHHEFERKNAARSKLLKRSAYATVLVLLAAIIFAFISSQPAAQTTSDFISISEIPNYPIHWHPRLSIKIIGQEQTIPANLGTTGTHQPVHTHDATGTLYYENSNPTPENMPLRYFFGRVWRKTFNSTCIMDYCNDGSGTVKMFINGKQSFEYENYIPKDKDEISIEFG